MSLKQFFVTISMLPVEKLKKLTYRDDETGISFNRATSSPSVPLIVWNSEKGDTIEVIPVYVDDGTGASVRNLELFKNELAEAMQGIEYTVQDAIEIPFVETKQKQIDAFFAISSRIKSGADVFADITYGTKAMPVVMFSVMSYADNICRCHVKKVTYGKFNFYENEKNGGTIYDVRSLFEINATVLTLKYISREGADNLLAGFWGSDQFDSNNTDNSSASDKKD